MNRDPRVKLYDGEIPLGAAVRANFVTVLARAAVLWQGWLVAAVILGAGVARLVWRGFPLWHVITVLLSYVPVGLAFFVLTLTLARTAWTCISQRRHVLRLGMLRDGWRTAAVWVDQPKSGGPWRVQLMGALPFRRGLGAPLMREALRYADTQRAVLTARARTPGLAAVYARYGFTHDAPGSRRMTRRPPMARNF